MLLFIRQTLMEVPLWPGSWLSHILRCQDEQNKIIFLSSFISKYFSLFFFLPFCKCVCGMHGIHPCVDAYMCCTWVSVQAYACTRVHRKWILAASTSGVFFHWAPFYVLKPGLLLNLKLAILGSLASLFSPRVYPALPPGSGITGFYMDAENPNSSPQPCEARAVFTEPSL